MCVGVRKGEMQGGAFTRYQEANWGNWQENQTSEKVMVTPPRVIEGQ